MSATASKPRSRFAMPIPVDRKAGWSAQAHDKDVTWSASATVAKIACQRINRAANSIQARKSAPEAVAWRRASHLRHFDRTFYATVQPKWASSALGAMDVWHSDVRLKAGEGGLGGKEESD
jgi:hypothetical protein